MKKLGSGFISLALAFSIGGKAFAQSGDSAASAGSDTSAPPSGSESFDNRFYLAPMGAMAISRHPQSFGDAFGGGLAIGKSVIPHLGVEIVGDYLHYKGKSVTTPGSGLICGLLSSCPDVVTSYSGKSIYGGGLGLNGYVMPSNYGLFVHADAQAGDRFVWNAGLGLDLPIMSGAFAVRFEALYHKELNVNPEPLYHLGVRIPLGSVPAPAAPPPEPPTQVVPAEAPPPPPPEPPPAPPPATCQSPAPGQPVSLEGCKVGDTIVLHGVNFDFNKATLTLNAKALLDQVADALLARKDVNVEVDGHTDGVGGEAYNQRLSEHRAASVRQYLIGRGVDAGRITSKGFGKSKPVASNDTEEGREQNRRVELKVVDNTGAGASGAEAGATAPAEAAPKHHRRAKHHAKPAVTGAPEGQAEPTAPEAAAPTSPSPETSSAPPPAPAPAPAPEAAPPAPPPPSPPPPQSGGENAGTAPAAAGNTSGQTEEEAQKITEQPAAPAGGSSSGG
jgi:outer membrane protein OmpA-like peptidoglycan-associated protein